MQGIVYIVGAGPGDPSLITVRGREVLKRADVILHDRLAAPELLSNAPGGAEIIFVGKQPGRHAFSQAEINALMAEKACEGRIVVRLKGGDPLIFGRGGEEADHLAAQGIEFEIIPGVSAACGAAASTGVPLTDRRISSRVTFVTAREGDGASTGVDWTNLAKTGGTLAIYMGRANLASTAASLVEGGLEASTACLVVERATLSVQRTVHSTLGEVASACEVAGIEPPCVVMVGGVTEQYPSAAWFEKRPLFSRHIMVTRPAGQQEWLLAAFTTLGARVSSFPTIEISPEPPERLKEGLLHLEESDWVVFTSANGVGVFFDALDAACLDARFMGGRRVAAIGSATGEALSRRGIRADMVPAHFTGAALLTDLLEESLPGQRILLWRADAAGRLLPEGLRKAGRHVVDFTAYRVEKPSQQGRGAVSALEAAPPDAILFTSGLTVLNFIEIVGRERALALVGRSVVVSIGPVTTAALAKSGIRVAAEAQPHDRQGLLDATLSVLGAQAPQWFDAWRLKTTGKGAPWSESRDNPAK